jgi:hypothetical protein
MLKTLNVSAALTVVPVDKMSDNAPDYRVYAGQRYEIGAGWSQVAKSSGETYLNLKIGAPEFGPNWGALPSCGGLRHGRDRDDAFPSGPIVDGAFTSSAETDAQGGLGQR